MKYRCLLSFAFAMGMVRCVAAPGAAQSSPAPSPQPAATASPAPATPAPLPRTIQLSGYAAAAYAHYAGTTLPQDRVFDTHAGDLNLQAVDVKAQVALPAGFGLTAESTFGTDADRLASRGTSNGDGFDLPQAFVSYARGGLTLVAGRFASLAGAEVFEDPQDDEFSRSILYGYAEPFTHTGLRATYAFDAGKYTFNAGVNNGWDDIKFVGKKKTFEVGPSIAISPAFTLAATLYDGQDFSNNYAGAAIRNDGDVGQRALYDVVLTAKATSALTFVSNYDNGSQQNAKLFDTAGTQQVSGLGVPLNATAHWTGFSQIADYQFGPKYGVALRGEVFHDGAGFQTGVDQYLREGTVTVAYTPSTPLLFRVEYRVDGSDHATFPQTSGGSINHQNSIEVETAVKF